MAVFLLCLDNDGGQDGEKDDGDDDRKEATDGNNDEKDDSDNDGKDDREVVDQWWTSGRLEFIHTTFYNSLLIAYFHITHTHT